MAQTPTQPTMDHDSSESAHNKLATLKRLIRPLIFLPAIVLIGVITACAIGGAIGVVAAIYADYSQSDYTLTRARSDITYPTTGDEEQDEATKKAAMAEIDEKRSANFRQMVSKYISLVILAALSAMASYVVFEIISGSERKLQRRANYIAMMIGLIAVFLLFTQPYLEDLFSGQSVHSVFQVLWLGGAAAGGWFAWYLKHVKTYGEFFEIFLLTFVCGFAWYARFSDADEIHIVAVAFIVASLFRIAKDYLDAARSDETSPKDSKV